MKHLAWIVLAALLSSVGSAQTTAPPAGADGAAVPAFGEAPVRFVHAAPNAGTVQLAARRTVAGAGDPGTVVELENMDGAISAPPGSSWSRRSSSSMPPNGVAS